MVIQNFFNCVCVSAKPFPSDIDNDAKLLRMALGVLIIQTKFQYVDHELVEQIRGQDISLLNETRKKLEIIIIRQAV